MLLLVLRDELSLLHGQQLAQVGRVELAAHLSVSLVKQLLIREGKVELQMHQRKGVVVVMIAFNRYFLRV